MPPARSLSSIRQPTAENCALCVVVHTGRFCFTGASKFKEKQSTPLTDVIDSENYCNILRPATGHTAFKKKTGFLSTILLKLKL